MTLREQIASDVAAVFLNVDDFAEQATYCPAAGGGESSLTVVVEEDVAYASDDAREQETDTVFVLCGRDPAATCGGIADPQLGDTLILADGRLLAFTGEKTDVEADTWTLTFKRRRTQVEGTKHRASG